MTTTRKGSLAELTTENLRKIVREEITIVISGFDERLSRVEEQIGKALELGTKVAALEAAADFTGKQLEDLQKISLPSIQEAMEKIATDLALRQLDQEVHYRKWSVTIHGIPGAAGESGATTRQKCVDLAKEYLRVPDADPSHLSACHRLSQKSNAGIIVRFLDLDRRNEWLAGARFLRDHPTKANISPDLPPVLRPLKTELLDARKTLPPDQKSRSSVRFLPEWPYVAMVTAGGGPKKYPSISKREIVSRIVNLNVIRTDSGSVQ